MAQHPPRAPMRAEVRIYLLVSAGAFALGLALGFVAMGLEGGF